MSLSQFKQLIKDHDLMNKVTEKEIPLLFNLSMMTQVDELRSRRIYEMRYVEFIEALGRLADKASLPRLGIPSEQVYSMFNTFRLQN
jgi:nitrate reductase beta subunit